MKKKPIVRPWSEFITWDKLTESQRAKVLAHHSEKSKQWLRWRVFRFSPEDELIGHTANAAMRKPVILTLDTPRRGPGRPPGSKSAVRRPRTTAHFTVRVPIALKQAFYKRKAPQRRALVERWLALECGLGGKWPSQWLWDLVRLNEQGKEPKNGLPAFLRALAQRIEDEREEAKKGAPHE